MINSIALLTRITVFGVPYHSPNVLISSQQISHNILPRIRLSLGDRVCVIYTTPIQILSTGCSDKMWLVLDRGYEHE